MRARTFIQWTAVMSVCAFAATAAHPGEARILRVCADPNNLPFSNAKREGFENRIADLIARDLGARVSYTWWAQRRGFVRNTLNAAKCDVVMGVPASFDMTAVTLPYYRSSYVFVSRADRKLNIESFDDPALRNLRIGVQLVGDDGSNTPPVHALSSRGIKGLTGFPVYGDYRSEIPSFPIIQAVVNGKVDVAIVWGPQAGFLASKQSVPLRVVPVSPQIDVPFMPEVFDIAMGVRRQDKSLRDELDSAIIRNRDSIDAILDQYKVPRLSSRSGKVL